MADYLSKFSGEEIDSLLDKIKDFNVINEIPSKSITDDKIADSSITTSLLSNGSVTMPKLGNDVTELITEIKNKGIINESRSKQNEIDIKTNQNFSLFNSDRLNILEAQINADKNTIEYTSDKPLEITCNGANIIDCNARFKKVEGQTRRYSPNIVELTTSTYNDPAGRYTLEVKGNASEVILKTKTIDEVISVYFNNRFTRVTEPITIVNCGTEEFYVEAKKTTEGSEDFGIEPNNVLVIDNTKYKEIALYKYLFALDKYQNKTFVFKPMVLKGRYTAETIPPFQPYDNTLVNSKANFVSTGRNLFKGGYVTKKPNGMTYTLKGTRLEVSGTPTALAFDFLMNVTLPKGTYYVEKANMQGTIAGSNYIQINKGTQWFANEGKFTINETTTLSICYTIGADNKGKPINASFDIMISYGSSTKPYEPYTKNISQYDIELGAYDYIENGNLIKQTSEMITLNGSENWSIDGDSPNKRFVTYDKAGSSINDVSSVNLVTNSLLQSVTANHTWSDGTINNMISISNGTYHLVKKGITTIEQLKQWLAQNPITLVYQKATPTITPIVVPNGIVSHKNGLTSQEIKGKYLPYKYTAKYVNGGQQ